jgi:hypothetical protein
MTDGFLGSPTGNTLVPIQNFTKQTKIISTTNSAYIEISGSTISSPTVIAAYFMAYADSNNIWRLRFNIAVAFTSGGARTSGTLTFKSTYAVTFKNTSGFYQPVFGFSNNGTLDSSFANPNAATITINHGSANTGNYYVSGDVELESEPSWYAANAEGNVNVAAYFPSASASTAGLVDTTTQSFAGVKTFTNGIILPTSDPHVAGALWNSTGTLTISAG